MSAPGFLLSPRLRRHFGEAEARRAALSKVSNEVWVGRQLTAFQQVLADACADVPYYGDLVAQGLAPRDIRSWQDVRSIPVLHRQAFQDQPDRLLPRSRRPDTYMRSAGSISAPLKICMTQTERDLMRVVTIASWHELRYTPASRVFPMWGHSQLHATGVRGTVNHL